jgi:predicted phosphate transport protein (TIGR00153 family)
LQIKIGKDNSFYLILEAQAEVAHRSALAFREATIDLGRVEEHAKNLAQLEAEGDELTHRLQDHVALSFITPIDKEDLRALSQTLDDITDAVEAATARFSIYRLNQPRRDLVPFADLMIQATAQVMASVGELKTGFGSESLQNKLTSIHTIEGESDILYRRALQLLFFEPNADPLNVIKWKEVYDRIEIAMDSCEDIAKILGTIVVKYG